MKVCQWFYGLLMGAVIAIAPALAGTALADLPVKAIPERSTLTFRKELMIPANHARVEIAAPYDLTCFVEIHPIDNRTRFIRAGSLFYVTAADETPPRVQVETRRNTLLTFACEPRPETLRAGNMDEFFLRYAERMNLNFKLSVRRFESVFRGLFKIQYSDPIEIEPNANVAQPALALPPPPIPPVPVAPLKISPRA